jgi:hypothetical protein
LAPTVGSKDDSTTRKSARVQPSIRESLIGPECVWFDGLPSLDRLVREPISRVLRCRFFFCPHDNPKGVDKNAMPTGTWAVVGAVVDGLGSQSTATVNSAGPIKNATPVRMPSMRILESITADIMSTATRPAESRAIDVSLVVTISSFVRFQTETNLFQYLQRGTRTNTQSCRHHHQQHDDYSGNDGLPCSFWPTWCRCWFRRATLNHRRRQRTAATCFPQQK